MLNHSCLLSVTHSAVLEQISIYIYEAVLEMQRQHPEWLKEKYRKVTWQDDRYQSIFKDRLKQELLNASDQKAQLLKVRKFLQLILETSFFESAEFKVLVKNLRQIIVQPETPSNGDEKSAGAIAILLLDAENLQLDVETEKFLEKICTYPIQIKIAFANWRSMGRKDAEFHERHYELIHVPPGKDSADLKMATVGSSIFVHYPNAKEVLVCSSDNAIIHLCTTLQTHGLTVYRVRKQKDAIAVFNSKTGQTQTHSLKPIPEMPSVEEFIASLKQLIKAEQLRTGSQWLKLSRISNLFQSKYQFTITQVVATHFPGKRTRDIFFEYPSEFVAHQVSERSQVYITLFEMADPKVLNGNGSTPEPDEQNDIVNSSISSQAELEEALVNLLKNLTAKYSKSAISMSSLGSEFYKKYGKTISKIMDELNLNGNFPKFIKSCSSLKLGQTKKGWQVAIAQTDD
ncbi:MAG TPA: NYN domain-containing protein [Cyanobacteria bacterium UBA11369]|nr:NYN domain-containing protein [Cyanobacteria bacterium UBA11371]HBE35834.1 NYN domain-containing protein [Cyanobacteria bacterium UBA11368]HBE49763.1 NYN domain-containing protein [Cyanobacteria bacterium UBA11369]